MSVLVVEGCDLTGVEESTVSKEFCSTNLALSFNFEAKTYRAAPVKTRTIIVVEIIGPIFLLLFSLLGEILIREIVTQYSIADFPDWSKN